MNEKVTETNLIGLSSNNSEVDESIGNIRKKEIYQIPLSQQKFVALNQVISKHVTKDLFEKSKIGTKRYEYWKKYPVKAISYLDHLCRTNSMHFMDKSARTSSPIIKLLLRLRGENRMEQLNKEIDERKAQIEQQNQDAKANIDETKNDSAKKEVEIILEPHFIEDIKQRSDALAKEDKCKKELVKQAKEKGWMGVTVDEIDLDLTDNYRKIAKQLEGITKFGKDDIKLLSMMQSIRRDKIDIHKFRIDTEIKIAGLKEQNELRKKVTGLVMVGMDAVD